MILMEPRPEPFYIHLGSAFCQEKMLFIIIAIIILALMYGYIGWRLIIPAPFGPATSLILWGILLFCLLIFVLPHLLRHEGIEIPFADTIAWISYLSFGILTLLFAVLLARDLIFLLITGLQKSIHIMAGIFGSNPTITETVNPIRRSLITNSVNVGLLGLTGALTGYGLFEALRKPDIVEIDIPIKNLPEDFNGFRIVQITDIHVSNTLRRPFVQHVVDTVKKLRPDLIALTGDLVDGTVAELGHDVAPLADLNAPYGMYFITGNHEYYSGVQQWVEETARLGFDVLLNEHRIIRRGNGRLILAGVTDYSGGQFDKSHISDPHKALSGAPSTDAKILLAHQPRNIFEAAKAGYDYVISGHTHGGQYFPYHLLAALAQPYVSGFHRHGNTAIYVSKGTGYWGPQIRIGARSEITVHRLVSA
jgi:predicted MPP superfamily phosphohydrolase